MGGLLSGRYETTPKTDDALALDVIRLHRDGALGPGVTCERVWTVAGQQVGSVVLVAAEDALWLSFISDGLARQQRVPVEKMQCYFGGSRPWFRCPICERRVGVIYFGGGHFACRECQGLKFAVRSLRPRDRWLRRSRKLRERLGAEPRIESVVFKPKGMHRSTYERQAGLIRDLERAVLWSAYDRLLELKRRRSEHGC